MKIHIVGNQANKIQYLQDKGGILESCIVKIKMRDGTNNVATIDDWGRVTWSKGSNEDKSIERAEESGL